MTIDHKRVRRKRGQEMGKRTKKLKRARKKKRVMMKKLRRKKS